MSRCFVHSPFVGSIEYTSFCAFKHYVPGMRLQATKPESRPIIVIWPATRRAMTQPDATFNERSLTGFYGDQMMKEWGGQ